VSENRDFVQRKREVVSFSPNDTSSVESFLQVRFSPFIAILIYFKQSVFTLADLTLP
jgi:nucleolar complex protein 2